MIRRHPLRVLVIVVGWTLILTGWSFAPHPDTPQFHVTPPPEENSRTPVYRENFVSQGDATVQTREVHASAVHAMEEGVMAYWFGGSREGAADVRIYQARYNSTSTSNTDSGWQTPRAIVDTPTLNQELHRHIRKVGNPVSYRWPDGTIQVFLVSVSIGGWGGSSINLIESHDNGQTWSPARRLVTSPFLNISTLVRNAPVEYQDGTIGLPVYHEFLGKFAELLRLNQQGRILAKTRLTHGTYSLQPTVAVLSETNALALLRYAGEAPNRVMQQTTEDGGQTWTRPEKIAIPNPDSAIATMTHRGRVIAVLNDTEAGRHKLSLMARSQNAWQNIHVVEEARHSDNHESQFSYPSITRDSDGLIHLLYTWNKSRIRHVTFNTAWLDWKLR